MAEILTSDNSVTSEVMESQVADEAESLAIGEEMIQAQEQRLAGKYKTTEELESAYLELQKKLGQEETSEEPQAETETETETEEYDYSWLNDAYESIRESGELSDEIAKNISDMDSLEVFAAMAASSSEGQAPEGRELSTDEVSSIYTSVGGEDSYNSLVDWAKDNFSETEIDAYDQMVESGNVAQINLALQALNYRYTDAMGQEGEMLQGKPAAAQAGFRSQQELIQAMNDPRYDNDPAYRSDVLEKLDRSELSF